MTPTPLASDARLYAILDLAYVKPENAIPMARSLIRGGADVLQLRAKSYPADSIRGLAIQLLAVCREARIPFIVNDHVEIARQIGADGAHIGQDDGTVAWARELLGPGRIVGKSTHGIAQAVAAAGERPDYIGFGPLFATPTKPDYTPIGLCHVARVHELVKLPIFCIGGIKPQNLAQVLAAGAQRVVIVSGLLLAENPEATAREIRAQIPAPAPPEFCG